MQLKLDGEIDEQSKYIMKIRLLCARLKERIVNFINKFERKPIIYDFDMKDFFTEEGRVKENRQRLRELYDQYKRIENYYPIFLAYLTAVGIFIFDLIAFGSNHTELYYYVFLTIITTSSIIYTCYLIWKVFKGNPWTHDFLPKDVCEDYNKNILADFPNLKPGSKEFNDEIIKRYRIALDGFVIKNYKTYDAKIKRLGKVWLPLIISLILLSVNTITYKSIKMEKLNEDPEERITSENVENKTEKELLIEILKEARKEKESDNFDKMKNMMNKENK